MRVLTWNVYFGGYEFDARAAALVDELGRRRPEVILLQEVTEELLARLVAAPWVGGYELSDRDGATIGGYGVVAMARVPVGGFRWLDLPTEMGRSLLTMDLDDLTVATVHLESTASGKAHRLLQLARIQESLRKRDDILWAGDMNFAPDDTEETAALDADLVDVWPALRPGEPGYTVDTAVNEMRYLLQDRWMQKRIDRVFVRGARWRPTAIELVGTAPIDDIDTYTSDHFGLEVTLERA